MQNDSDSNKSNPGILDTVGISSTKAALREFDPQTAVLSFLEGISNRERQVLISRYGLEDGQEKTLEQIGESLSLTRERVRQIEKEVLHKLSGRAKPQRFIQGIDLVFKVIEDNGGIATDKQVADNLLASDDTPASRNALFFLIGLSPEFKVHPENNAYTQFRYLAGFDPNLLNQVVDTAQRSLTELGTPVSGADLWNKICAAPGLVDKDQFSTEAFESILNASKLIDKNPFGQWGLANWPQIHPRDVGDKAHLVLLHHGKPEHYSIITDLVNKQGFDKKIAQKESVHNELIKDKRFVLVGRGIYALNDWGYQRGLVSDVIADILQKAGRPLTRDEIIDQVLKQRMVKRNTIIVGLSNKNKFKKTSDGKFVNVI